VARNVSTFVRTSESTADLGADALDALAAAVGPPATVATLILPADVSWSEGGSVADGTGPTPPARGSGGESPDGAAVSQIADALRMGGPSAILIGGRACTGPALRSAADIAAATGARFLCETFPARLERGAGRPGVDRLAYLAEFAAIQLEGIAHLVLVDARSPVSFFAYPGRPSDLVPDGCTVVRLAGPSDDVPAALAELAHLLGVKSGTATPVEPALPPLPTGELTSQAVCQALGALLPEGAIVSDEGNTSGLFAPGATAGSPPHDWLCLTGGAIGQGLPVAVGAAVASRDRRVVALESDGSALYTLQAWWTMARENLDVTTIVLNNHSYAVLNMELDRVGVDKPGPLAREMLDLGDPSIDFVHLARGLGLHATRAETAEEFADQLARALATPGPNVVEAVVPPLL
jgi:acetolactate synthase-1/2/3 large subunit